jgi:HD-GYP domain-containing protein (c-di-GMP phosphodiesterase class II)
LFGIFNQTKKLKSVVVIIILLNQSCYAEGHSRRVVEWTLRLASKLGFGEEELLSIRWGALLHDIGKLGIPDLVLQKPGQLTEEE